MKQIRFDNSSGLIKVVASINGLAKQNYQIVLAIDTGSYFSTFRPEVLEDVGYIPSNEKVLLTGIANSVEASFEIISELNIADVTTTNYKVAIHDIPLAYGIDGLLGNDFLRGHKISIDYPKGIITFE